MCADGGRVGCDVVAQQAYGLGCANRVKAWVDEMAVYARSLDSHHIVSSSTSLLDIPLPPISAIPAARAMHVHGARAFVRRPDSMRTALMLHV